MTSSNQRYTYPPTWTSSSRLQSPQPQASPPPQRLPRALTEASEPERQLFAAAVFRTQEDLALESRNLKTLFENFQRKERDRTHEPIDAILLEALFSKIRYETWGKHLNALVPVRNKDAQELVANLRMTTAYWVPVETYEKLYMASPPRENMFQGTNCNGCVLAAIAGDIVSLEALRIAVYGRKHRGGRLIPWLDAWIRVHGEDMLRGIRERSETVGRIIRHTRRASFVDRERQVKKDKRAREKSLMDELKYKDKLKIPDPHNPGMKGYRQENTDIDPFADSHAIHVSDSGPVPVQNPEQESFYGNHFDLSKQYLSDPDAESDGGYTSEYSAIRPSTHYQEIERNGGWI